MKEIKLNLIQSPLCYSVTVEKEILSKFHLYVKNVERYRNIVIIYDSNIETEFLSKLIQSISDLKIIYNLMPIDLSSSSKSFDLYMDIIKNLIELNCSRDTLLVAFGGGSIGDTVGFVSSTYLRGIDYINIPTTLLSMIDSSIGGKTGLDFKQGKNLIGSFYHPQSVLIDLALLESLDKREFNSGLFEAIKYGLIQDKKLFSFINDNIHKMSKNSFLEELVYWCCSIKINIVKKDEKDIKERMKLNFGHTIGHAIESKYKIRHGEAIGYGMICASYISREVGTLSDESLTRINSIIRKNKLHHLKPNADDIINFLSMDKKIVKGNNNFILLNGIGNSYISSDVNNKLIRNSIQYL